MRNSDIEWQRLGQSNPYYGVVTTSKYLGQSLEGTIRNDFFQTGIEQTEAVFANIERYFKKTNFRPSLGVDFGCGVGRLAIPLARRCQHVYAFDVSEAMLSEASNNAQKLGISNIDFLKSDNHLSALNEQIDFFLSLHVFQHIPVERGMMILQKLLAQLKPNGIGVVHLPYFDSAHRLRKAVNWAQRHLPACHGLVNLLKRRAWSSPYMQMNTYDINAVLLLLSTHGCEEIQVQTIRYERFRSLVFYFQKKA